MQHGFIPNWKAIVLQMAATENQLYFMNFVAPPEQATALLAQMQSGCHSLIVDMGTKIFDLRTNKGSIASIKTPVFVDGVRFNNIVAYHKNMIPSEDTEGILIAETDDELRTTFLNHLSTKTTMPFSDEWLEDIWEQGRKHQKLVKVNAYNITHAYFMSVGCWDQIIANVIKERYTDGAS